MKHLFILNPVAGENWRIHSQIYEHLNEVMSKRGENYEIYVTARHMDAAEKVNREAIFGNELRVYACGGDGTLSECVHGAAGYDNVSVTHYPCGTGNDFIKTFGDDAALFSDVDALASGFTRYLDIIDVNGRKCLNIASVGIDARIGVDVHKYSRLPIIGGSASFVTSLVINFIKGINQEMRICGEGQVFEGKSALMCACNGRYYGGGFNPVCTAQPDDGLLDFLVVGKVSRFKATAFLGKYSHGEYEKMPELVTHFQGKKITVESDKEFCINVDGECINTKSAEMRLIPRGVKFLFPRGTKFFDLRDGKDEGFEQKTVV